MDKTYDQFVRNPSDGTYSVVEKLRRKFKPSTLITYRTDAVLERTYKPVCAGTVSESKGTIGVRPSKRSLQNLVFKLNNCDVPMKSMLTITMSDQVSKRNSVEFHRKTLSLALQKLRDDGVSQYCWVREFQENRSVHWHIFTDLNVANKGGSVNDLISGNWRRWMVSRYRGSGWCNEECYKKMLHGNGSDFKGCCRFEQLFGDAGGRYAGKEGSKRFQKTAPKRWRNGGAWWRASSNVKCTPTGIKKINGDRLEAATVLIKGVEREIPYRVQFNQGHSPQ